MKNLPFWIWSMILGAVISVITFLIPSGAALAYPWSFGLFALVGGIAWINAASESLIHASEILSARKNWNHFVGGTVGEIISTLPEFVVITFVVAVDPVAALIIAIVTIYNNAVIFSIYSFFLPKTGSGGEYALPAPIYKIGREILIVGSTIALILGMVFLIGRLGNPPKLVVTATETAIIGAVMLFIFAQYLGSLISHYSEIEVPDTHRPTDRTEETAGRMSLLFAVGTLAAFVGGHMVAEFAEIMLHKVQLPPVRAALVLAFFAGMAEIFIVIESHLKKEYEIALSNAFGGITQVKFLVFPFTLILISTVQWLGLAPAGFVGVPIDTTLIFLMLQLFPIFFVLFELMQDGHTLSNFDGAAMLSLFFLIIYFLVNLG
ncbi:MAG TPA: hypothetical protein DDZ83_09615 [Nitrospinae bacterium]|nr:hypothetical protein [Nitrospinota bacterium]